MTNNPRKVAHYTRERAKLYKLLNDFMESEEYQNDPISQRLYELTGGKHGRLEEAMKIACEEFDIK